MRLSLTTAAAAIAIIAGCDGPAAGAGGSLLADGPSCRCPPAVASLAEPGARPIRGGEVSVRIESEPGTLLSLYSPHEAIGQIIDHDVLEALVDLDPETGEPVPELAQSWEVDEGAGTYVFHVHPEARWHDGPPVTSADVAYTFDLLLDPAGGAVRRNEFSDIDSVETPDEVTVVFALDQARQGFIADLSRIAILPLHVFGTEVAASHPASRAPVGSGPFVFREWRQGSHIDLEPNPDWRGAPVNVDRVRYRVVPERRVAMDLYRGGELDVVTDAGPMAALFTGDGRVLTYPLSMFEAIVYNTGRPCFLDAAARRAIGSLIDRETIRCSILGCRAQLIDDPWPPLERASGDVPFGIFFDPGGARAALTAAGWKDRDGDGVRDRGGASMSFALMYPDADRDLRRAMTVVQQDLARAGIGMRLEPVSRAIFSSRLLDHRFDAAVVMVSNRHPFDPTPYFASHAAGTGRNYALFSDSETDRLLDSLSRETGAPARKALVHQLDRRLLQEHPVTFTFRPHAAVIARRTVRNLVVRNDWIDERELWIDPAGTGGAR